MKQKRERLFSAEPLRFFRENTGFLTGLDGQLADLAVSSKALIYHYYHPRMRCCSISSTHI